MVDDVNRSINPSQERLYSKITDLEQALSIIRSGHLDPTQLKVAESCQKYIALCWDYLRGRRKHSHLVWEFLHRVDENLILLMPEEEFTSKATEVAVSFDMSIQDEKLRKAWLGEKGILTQAVERIQKGWSSGQERHVVKDALELVNEHMDRSFWQLSMNTLTSVVSGCMLGILVLLFWWCCLDDFDSFGDGSLQANLMDLLVLGLMGAYLGNLLTWEGFLYVRGAPFWRYFLHNTLSKPILGAFAAVFVFMIEKTKTLFSISVAVQAGQAGEKAAAQIVNFNVSSAALPYAYALLAIVSGFAAEKVLRSMIDTVLKRLEERAEKRKTSSEQGES